MPFYFEIVNTKGRNRGIVSMSSAYYSDEYARMNAIKQMRDIDADKYIARLFRQADREMMRREYKGIIIGKKIPEIQGVLWMYFPTTKHQSYLINPRTGELKENMQKVTTSYRNRD